MTKSTRDLLISFFGIIALAALFAAAYYASGVHSRSRADWRAVNYIPPTPPPTFSPPPFIPPAPPASSTGGVPVQGTPADQGLFRPYNFVRVASVPSEISGYISQTKNKPGVVSARLVIGAVSRPVLLVERGDSGDYYEITWSTDVSGLLAYGTNEYTIEATLTNGASIREQQTITIYGPPIDPVSTSLAVRWLEQPVSITIYDVFGSQKIGKASAVEGYGRIQEIGSSVHKIGTVSLGVFSGYTLYLVNTGACRDEMGCSTGLLTVLKGPDKKTLLLTSYSDSLLEGEAPLFDEQLPNVVVPDLERPKTFTLNGLTMREYAYGWGSSQNEYWFNDQELVPIATHPQWGTVYTTPIPPQAEEAAGSRAVHAFYIRLPDNRIRAYTYDVPFMKDRTIAQVTWTGGEKNTADYSTGDSSGCGGFNAFAVRSEAFVKPATRLSQAGKTNTGDDIFVLKDIYDAEYKDLYVGFQGYSYGNDEPRVLYHDFIRLHPLFYWKDPFGRWIRFVRKDVLPAAECGKPVIYLYPQKTTSARVQVGLIGKMTASEPAYGSLGWSVVAEPDGYVRNVADGKIYPNLYWEGVGVRYATPSEGFVIKTSDADQWLRTTLATIGFTDRESREFREFWVPRMPQTPYSFITFASQADFDRDAPLHISPKPDVINRVFMITRGLDSTKAVTPLNLPTIVRRGFTVVEWGGELRK